MNANTTTRHGAAWALGLAALLAFAPSAAAEAFRLGAGDPEEVLEFQLAVGKTQLLVSPRALKQVVVGDPSIADVQLLSDTQLLLQGKKAGITNVAFRDRRDAVIAVLDVVVGYDTQALKHKLHETLPLEKDLEVRTANGRVMLTGSVSTARALDTALAVADTYAKGGVVNMVAVNGGNQVLLEARIAEVARNRVRELGVQTNISTTSGGNPITLFSGTPLTTGFGAGATFNGSKVDVNLQALEQEGAAKVLAEPNIVALSGQEASFLVGGEFPVPIAQAGAMAGAISIDYKQFGVGLRFTPTVLSPDQISLKLATEVSAIDDTTGTSVLGTTVPGLRTRRAATTIEMGDGQAFAVAGLLQDDFASVANRFPGLGSIPFLGALFRSSDFKNRRTELVVMVTPRLVKAVPRGTVALPTDGIAAPSPFDQYLMGRPLAPRAQPEAPPTAPADKQDGARF